jgi:hypothetical protein
MIKSLRATNLKGRNFDLSFGKLNFITGENFVGKTAILDAIRLAMLGGVPELGATARAQFQLAGGSETVMSATVTMDDSDTPYSRSLSLVKGVVKTDGTDKIELPLLSPEAFFTMTEKEQREYVSSRFNGGLDLTTDGIMAGIERLSFGEDHSEAIEAAKAEILPVVRQFVSAKDKEQGISNAIAALKTMFTTESSKAKDTAGAVRVLSELKAKESVFTGLPEITAAIAAVRQELAEANEAKGKLIGQRDAFNKAKVANSTLEARLNTPAPAPFNEPEPPSPTHNLIELRKQVTTLQGLMAEEKRNSGQHAIRLSNLKVQLAEVEEQITKLDSLECCPFCKSDQEGWNKPLRSFYVEKRATITDDARQAKADLDDAVSREHVHGEKMKSVSTLLGQQEVIAEAHQAWMRRAATAKAVIEEDQKQREALKEQLNAASPQPPSESDIILASRKVEELQVKARGLEESRSIVEGIQNDIKRAAQSAQANTIHEAKKDVIKLVGRLLVELQEKAVSGVFVEMLAIANRIAGTILNAPIAFHEGEIGRWKDGRFISHKTFSGTEKTVCYSAIAAALSSKAKHRIMLVDEVSRLSPSMLVKFADVLAERVEDNTLDQVIMVAPSDSSAGVEFRGDWNIIRIQ